MHVRSGNMKIYYPKKIKYDFHWGGGVCIFICLIFLFDFFFWYRQKQRNLQVLVVNRYCKTMVEHKWSTLQVALMRIRCYFHIPTLLKIITGNACIYMIFYLINTRLLMCSTVLWQWIYSVNRNKTRRLSSSLGQ